MASTRRSILITSVAVFGIPERAGWRIEQGRASLEKEEEEEEEPWEFGDDKKYAVVVGLVVFFVWKTKGRVNSLSHGGP